VGGLAISATLGAASAAQPEVSITKYKDRAAFATFFNIDETGCGVTAGDVHLSNEELVDPSGQKFFFPTAYVNYQSFDVCTGQIAIWVESSSGNDCKPNNSGMNEVRLDCVMRAVSLVDGALAEVHVDVTWEGIGPLDKLKERFRFTVANTETILRFKGLTRPAQATGTLTINGSGPISFTSDSAEIQRVTQGEMTKIRR
jgi:hypothetical protein